jgi:hypothetical protein
MALADRVTLTESGFMFDHHTGMTYTLNNTGTAIMQLLIDERDSDEILNELTNRYEADERDVRNDLDQFVAQIKKLNLM